MADEKLTANKTNTTESDEAPYGEASVMKLGEAHLAVILGHYMKTGDIKHLAVYVQQGGKITDDIRNLVANKLLNPEKKHGRPNKWLDGKRLLDEVRTKKLVAKLFFNKKLSDRAALKQIVIEENAKRTQSKRTEQETEQRVQTLQRQLLTAKKSQEKK